MKRSVFGILAIAIAIAAFAFTTPVKEKKSLLQTTFYYVPPSGSSTPYSQSNVEDENRWFEAPGTIPTCDNVDDGACSILVDNSNTVVVSGVRHLNFTMNAKQG